jgi:hypothetical protein
VSISHLLSEIVEYDQEKQQAAERKKFGYMSQRVVAALRRSSLTENGL